MCSICAIKCSSVGFGTGATNAGNPTTPIVPPRAATARIWSSRRLRTESHTARQFAWLKTGGALDTSIASIVVRYPVCDKSTMRPRRFISWIIRTPNRDSPASVRSSQPSPTRFLRLYVELHHPHAQPRVRRQQVEIVDHGIRVLEVKDDAEAALVLRGRDIGGARDVNELLRMGFDPREPPRDTPHRTIDPIGRVEGWRDRGGAAANPLVDRFFAVGKGTRGVDHNRLAVHGSASGGVTGRPSHALWIAFRAA